MSLAEIEKRVIELPEEERRQFASWFYEHESEIAGPADDASEEESEEMKAELLRRQQEMEEHPEEMVTFDIESFDRMVREFVDERAQKTSAGSH